jgi:hypothetical protein
LDFLIVTLLDLLVGSVIFIFGDSLGPGTSCGTWNDSYVGTSNYNFFQNWFQEFSEFSANDFYIAGESYAGVYVPTIVCS